MKIANDTVATAFNNAKLELSSDRQNVINYMLYESEEDPLDIVKHISDTSQMQQVKKSAENQTRNSVYYIKKLMAGLMLIDYSYVEKKNIRGDVDNG